MLKWHGREYAGVQTFPVNRKHSDCSKALRIPQKVDLCVLASSSCGVYAETQGRKVRPVAGFILQALFYDVMLWYSICSIVLCVRTKGDDDDEYVNIYF